MYQKLNDIDLLSSLLLSINLTARKKKRKTQLQPIANKFQGSIYPQLNFEVIIRNLLLIHHQYRYE